MSNLLNAQVKWSVPKNVNNPVEIQITLTFQQSVPFYGTLSFYESPLVLNINSLFSSFQIASRLTEFELKIIANNIRVYTYACGIEGRSPDYEDENVSEYIVSFPSLGTDGGGCTDISANNYDPNAIYDNGTCTYGSVILGCTNPNALNYNPDATQDNGSCIFDITNPEIDIPYIGGCTNPLALNFNEYATVNDGSCIFLSGCTITTASNYNEEATVDDGSCVCDAYTLLFSPSGEVLTFNFPQTASGDTSCLTVFEFDYIIKADCSDILDFYLENDINLSEILSKAGIYFNIFRPDDLFNIYSKKLWNYDFSKDHSGLYLYGDNCDPVLDIIRTENGLDCNAAISDKFTVSGRSESVILTDNLTGQYYVGLSGKDIPFAHSIEVKNIRFNKYCTTTFETCVLLPSKYGFTLEKLVDNTKTAISENNLILNSKEAVIRLNPINYIHEDMIDYLNIYSYLIRELKLYSFEKVDDFIDVRNRQTVDTYIYYNQMYEWYVHSFDFCGKKSKELTYDYIEQIYERINPAWRDEVVNNLPATTIVNVPHYFYANFPVHQQKHDYRKYTLDKGCDGDADIHFNIITDDPCIKDLTYKSRYEEIILNNQICFGCPATGVTYSFFDDGNNESARLIQYEIDTPSGITEVINFETVNISENLQITGLTADIINDEIVIAFTVNEFIIAKELIIDGDDVSEYLIYDSENNSFSAIYPITPEDKTFEIVINLTSNCDTASQTVEIEYCKLTIDSYILTTSPLGILVQGQVRGINSVSDMTIYLNTVILSRPISLVNNDYTFFVPLDKVSGSVTVEVTADTICGLLSEDFNIIV